MNNIKNLTLDSLVDTTFYRVLTGACEQGTREFCNRKRLTYDVKISIREVLEITVGEFGHEQFKFNLKELGII